MTAIIKLDELPQNHGKCPKCSQETGNVRAHFDYYHISKEDKLVEMANSFIKDDNRDSSAVTFTTLHQAIRSANRDDVEGLVFNLMGQLNSVYQRERKSK